MSYLLRQERNNMNQRIKSSGLPWLILAAIIFIIDIASKFYIHHSFHLYESVSVFPFFSITYVRNIGAAFSLFAGQRWPLAIIAILISLFIVYMLYKNSQDKKLENISLALILGGALGNLFDRLYHGFVVDFLDVHFGSWHYPTFNLADCAICIGVVLLIFSNYQTKRVDKS